MKRIVKLLAVLGAIAPLTVFGATPTPTPANATNSATAPPPLNVDSLFTNTLVAKGKGVSITRSQLDNELVRVRSTLAAQGRALPPDSPELDRQVLDNLIAKQLLLGEATPADKIKGKVEFQVTLDKIKTAEKLTGKEFDQRLEQQLQLLGETKAQWEQQSIDQATLPVVLERELKISVTDEQAKKFYDENPAKFEEPERVRVEHIMLSTRDPKTGEELSDARKAAKKKELEGILKRARAGEDFAKLAKEYSEDPGSKDRGGEYTFARGQMTPAFEAAAFSLKTNQISDIVTTPYGYHIIKLLEKLPAKKLAFDEEKTDIKQYLAQAQMQKLLPDYLEKLKKAADVHILDPRLKAAEVPAPPADSSSTGGSNAAPSTEDAQQ